LPDFTQIYVDYNKNFSKPKGLIYKNYAVGILIKNINNYALGLLNLNKKTTYSVIIGKNEIPGIYKNQKILFIPKYKKINIGDIVKTSGLDGVFYKGALVGKIVKICQKKLYQEAKIKLFYDKLNPDFLFVYEGAKDGLSKH
jgi:rod shape-determining protein MreC